MPHISVIASVADPNSIRGRHGDDGMSGATRRACRDVRDDFNRRLKLDNGEDVEMRKKVLVLFGAVTLVFGWLSGLDSAAIFPWLRLPHMARTVFAL